MTGDQDQDAETIRIMKQLSAHLSNALDNYLRENSALPYGPLEVVCSVADFCADSVTRIVLAMESPDREHARDSLVSTLHAAIVSRLHDYPFAIDPTTRAKH